MEEFQIVKKQKKTVFNDFFKKQHSAGKSSKAARKNKRQDIRKQIREKGDYQDDL